MLSKKDIEELATGAVKRYFNTCNLISPQIQENDKTPDWDGYLNIYKEKKDVRRNFIGCIRIQVKGIQVNDFKKTESFPIETVFLNNARSEGFVFFVVEVKEDGIYINGKKTDEYTFKMDYYWMMGDNRHNSADSRYWGFVPEDHVVGKPIVVWLSLDKDRGWFDGKIRWNRLFKWVD